MRAEKYTQTCSPVTTLAEILGIPTVYSEGGAAE